MGVVRLWACIALLLALPLAAAEAPIRLQTDVQVGDQALTFDLHLRLAQDPRGVTRLTAWVDLAPVLPALRLALLRRLPHDPCRREGLDNWVADLRRLNLRVDQDWLLLELEFDAQAWACVDLRGSELRRRLSRASVRLLLPLRVSADGGGLRLHVDRPQVGARGPLADAARVWFALRGEELGDVLARRAEAINAEQLAFPPPSLWLHQGQLVAARFIDAGRPSLELVAELRPQLPGWLEHVWPWGSRPRGE